VQKILILEDDFDLAMFWKSELEELGYIVVHTRSGEEAIRLFTDEQPNLVISDILIRKTEQELERIGGLTLLSTIALSPNANCGMIAISGAHPSLNVLQHASSYGARTFVKPVAVSELLEAVKEMLPADD
jgi:CheY-like chemotaxis protein